MRTHTFVRAASLVTAAALVATMTACDGGGDSDASGATDITILAYQSSAVMEPIVDAFNESHPDIKVTLTTRGAGTGGDYANLLQTRIAGNQTPDVFQIVSENRSDVISNGIAMDLTDQAIIDTVDPSWLDLYRDGDKVYAVTFTAWMGGVMYNKDLLNKVGYDEVPATWSEFIDMGEALAEAGIAPYYEEQQIPSGSLTALLGSAFQESGAPTAQWVLDGHPEGETFADSWTPVLEQWNQLITSNVMPTETIGLDGDQIKSAFLNGEVAMFRSGNWHKTEVEEAGINYGFAAFPAFDGGKTYINGGGDPGYAVSASSTPEKQAAAMEFIDFLGSAEGVKMLCDGQGAMSISHEYSSDPGDVFRAAYEENLVTGQSYWIEWSVGSAPMVATMTAQQQLLIQGQATPQSFAEAMDSEFDKF